MKPAYKLCDLLFNITFVSVLLPQFVQTPGSLVPDSRVRGVSSAESQCPFVFDPPYRTHIAHAGVILRASGKHVRAGAHTGHSANMAL